MTDVRDTSPPAAVSVVIPTRDRPALVEATVRSILAGDVRPAEILVVDQSAEPDRALTRLSEHGCTVAHLHQRGRGASRARNHGIAEARHDVVALVDDDVLVTTTWLGTLLLAVTTFDGDCVVTGACLAPPGEQGFAPSLTDSRERVVYRSVADGGVLWTGNCAMRRRVVEAVGGFDVRLGPGTPFHASEDNDLSVRLLRAGYPIVFEPTAVLFHRAWRDRRQAVGVHWGYGVGDGALVSKRAAAREPGMGRALRGLVTGKLRQAIGALPRHPAEAVDALVYGAGVLYGAARWTVQHGRSP